ncbi:MAG: hypothetical protein LBT18_04070 [Endomicrobium sp.]|jgi:hypothetical protein|nr:hypothetical protein [Endomicrobium sp.]
MKALKYTILLTIIAFLLNSCGVTYQKDNLTQDLEKLVKKECKQETKAYIYGKTLYLDMELNGLTSKDQKIVSQSIHIMQTAILAITRVVLSSDSNIKYTIVTTYNHDKNVAFRWIQNIDDVKSYFYMRISHSDYNSRNISEIKNSAAAADMIADKHDITDGEYVARLIVSKVNTIISRYNTVFEVFVLQYVGMENKILVLSAATIIDNKLIPIIEKFLMQETQNYSKKYNIFFEGIKIIKSTGDVMLIISLNS